MSGEAMASDEKIVTFSVKSSSDQKYNVSVPESMTVLQLKTKLSTSEYADIPSERQRLIYSGRVLKDADALSTYKIKDGNTIHMVKGAASNQRQTPASQSSGTSTGTAQSNPAAAGVPQNLATGTGHDPMAGLTGARYAGFAQLPGANMFGPDGGMLGGHGPEEIASMLDNPMFASQINEAMNNPAVINMMTNHPLMQQNPMFRQAWQNPEFRRMMMDPAFIRNSLQMSRMLNPGGQSAMPAPGVTDTTPEQTGTAENTESTPQNNSMQTPTSSPPFNLFPNLGQSGAGGNSNPFAALFGGGMGSANPLTTNSTSTTSTPQNPNPNHSQTQAQPNQTPPFNPWATSTAGQQSNPIAALTQQMMQNPEMLQQAMSELQGFGMNFGGNQNPITPSGTNTTQPPQPSNTANFNPFSMFGQGGAGFGVPSPEQQQRDTRPPEELYSAQLGQLNEMGFFEFERNVRALRMAGGSVQGAIELLLSGTV